MSDYGLNGSPWRAATFEKTPDEIVTVPFAWAARLNGETISAATFELPDGLTNVAESGTASLRTVRLSGGTEGAVYRVIGKVTTSGTRTLEWVQRVVVREG